MNYKNKINATSYKMLLNVNNINNINNINNKVMKRNIKNRSHKKNDIKDDRNNRKISIEKVKNYLKIYYSNLKENKYQKELTIDKKEKPKTNISLKIIHKGYYKLENELNSILINYRKNLKDRYNKISMTNISTTPYNYKNPNKSRNSNNILFKQSSIYTGCMAYSTQNHKNKNYNHINTKSYNFCGSNTNLKINKKNNKYFNNNEKFYPKIQKDKKQKKMNNLSIKTENENKLLNFKNNISNTHKEISTDINYYNNNTIKNYHIKEFIKINKNEKLFKNNNLKKNELKKPILLGIKNNNHFNNTNSINFKKDKLRIKSLNKSRNYASNSCLNNFDDCFSTKKINSKNKSINFNSTNNIRNPKTYKVNKHSLLKKYRNQLNKNSNKIKHTKNITSNFMHISLPILNTNNKIYNQNSHKYMNSFHFISNLKKTAKYPEYKNKIANST